MDPTDIYNVKLQASVFKHDNDDKLRSRWEQGWITCITDLYSWTKMTFAIADRYCRVLLQYFFTIWTIYETLTLVKSFFSLSNLYLKFLNFEVIKLIFLNLFIIVLFYTSLLNVLLNIIRYYIFFYLKELILVW